MGTKIRISISLPPSQKHALARRAKRRRTTVSEEIRVALDKYLKGTNEETESQLNLLAAEASAAVDRMIHKLDAFTLAFDVGGAYNGAGAIVAARLGILSL